jgi:hypothetical protein
MKRRAVLLILPAALATSSASEDNLAGAKALLCSAVEASVCVAMDGCESGPATSWKVPQFLEIDLATKKLSTTAASGENRSTVASVLDRRDGLITLQGIEGGRAFSFQIREDDGTFTGAVAREDLTVSVFGACTPQTRP